VTTRPTPKDPSTTESLDLVISDFGEGQASDLGQSMGRKYYGNIEFWAPEVKRFHKYSFASDIYAIGIIMADMIEERWKAVLAKTERVDRAVPQCLLDIVLWCVAPQPQDRPQAKELRTKIEDLHQNVLNDDYEVVFTDLVQAPESTVIQAQMTTLDLDFEVQIDEDGIPF
jgi:serine/threonine protein kinase